MGCPAVRALPQAGRYGAPYGTAPLAPSDRWPPRAIPTRSAAQQLANRRRTRPRFRTCLVDRDRRTGADRILRVPRRVQTPIGRLNRLGREMQSIYVAILSQGISGNGRKPAEILSLACDTLQHEKATKSRPFWS